MTLRHLSQSGTWPSGNPRWYYRPKGCKAIPMPDLPIDAPTFIAAYAKASGGKPAAKVKTATGSIGAGITAFLASDRYLSMSASTRAVWRRGCDKIRTQYGKAMVADLAQRHIRADLAKLTAHPATVRLKLWRAICGWWVESGLAKIDATAGIKRPKQPKTDGHVPWTAADLVAFREHWPLHTAERLAFEFLHWTGARMSDAARLTEAMMEDGWLTYRQAKTGGTVSIPITANAPAFSDPSGQAELQAALAARPVRHLAFMVTAYGSSRSTKAASAWFASAARAAGVKGKSAHGLRKTRAITMAERGATTHQIAAWTGHESLAEVARYSRNADKRRIIAGPEQEQNSSNFFPSSNSRK